MKKAAKRAPPAARKIIAKSSAAASNSSAQSGKTVVVTAVAEAGEAAGSMQATWSTSVSLESLRKRQDMFAKERDWDQHHTPRNLALAMVGEVGELCECFQWRPDSATTVGLPGWSDADREHLGEEMSDVLLYLVRLADKCNVNLAEAVVKKIEKNAAKYPRDLVKGSSAKYTAYSNKAVGGAQVGLAGGIKVKGKK